MLGPSFRANSREFPGIPGDSRGPRKNPRKRCGHPQNLHFSFVANALFFPEKAPESRGHAPKSTIFVRGKVPREFPGIPGNSRWSGCLAFPWQGQVSPVLANILDLKRKTAISSQNDQKSCGRPTFRPKGKSVLFVPFRLPQLPLGSRRSKYPGGPFRFAMGGKVRVLGQSTCGPTQAL